MKKSQEIIQHLENKIKVWNEEAVGCAKKFMQTNQAEHKQRSQRLFSDIEYNKQLIRFIKEK